MGYVCSCAAQKLALHFKWSVLMFDLTQTPCLRGSSRAVSFVGFGRIFIKQNKI